jgi:hypothetical protein
MQTCLVFVQYTIYGDYESGPRALHKTKREKLSGKGISRFLKHVTSPSPPPPQGNSSPMVMYTVRLHVGADPVIPHSVAGVLDEPYSPLTLLSGAAVQARQSTYIGWNRVHSMSPGGPVWLPS